MCFRAIKLRVNNRCSNKYALISALPVFSWSLEHEDKSAVQYEYRIKVWTSDELLWDSGMVRDANSCCRYAGKEILPGQTVYWSIQIKDNRARLSQTEHAEFKAVPERLDDVLWITKKNNAESCPIYFLKQFQIVKHIKRATLYVSGIGCQRVFINGNNADDAVLQPMFCNYAKKCYYVALDAESFLVQGANSLAIKVGDGWRRNYGEYIDNMWQHPQVEFFGLPQLAAKLAITYTDGTETEIITDESWRAFYGGSVKSHLFKGETYNALKEPEGWTKANFDASAYPFAEASEDQYKLIPQAAEPIKIQRKIKPVSKIMIREGVYIFDFGENIAGYAEIRIPEGLKKEEQISLQFSEELDNNGDLEMNMMRGAVSKDEYISDGNDAGNLWSPEFLYHGFRYMRLEGWKCIPKEDDIKAVAVYSDVDNDSYFECGSALVNAIQDMILRTERSNLHGIATDCPQRDERMGWMNDATVRFEELPYNFNVSALLEKIIDDIASEQDENGAITDTAPFIAGNKPADPVCSAFIVAGMQLWRHYGNKEIIKKYYTHFKAWNECIKRMRMQDGIIRYGFYGDWAGTADSCVSMEDPHSAITPDELMWLGYHYYNYKALEKMAEILGCKAECEINRKEAEQVKQIFLDKWWNEDNGIVGTGSQACQAFALWLEILPESGRKKAAQNLYKAVESVGFRIKAGNLASRYVMDMLAEWGYIDAAWKIITREKYPSFGYMIQNEATTVWERYEQKNDSGMNSHNHPMYGAVGSWFYSHIAGVVPEEDGWKRFSVKPCIPEDLMYAKASVDTPRGNIIVKWFKRFGELNIHVSVPYGSTAEYKYKNDKCILKYGFHRFSYKLEKDETY